MFDLSSRDKPVLKWAGGKASLLPQLVPLFPHQFRRYIEPFLGGAAMFLALKPQCESVLGDSNPELLELYRVIRDEPEALMSSLDRLAAHYSEAFYYELRSQNPAGAVDKAARTIFLNKTGFNGLYRQNARGGFNVPFGKRKSCPRLYDRPNLLAVSSRLRRAKLVNTDFETLLRRAGRGDFVYCDPPYEPLSTTSSFNCYVGAGFSWRCQVRLRDACEKAVARGATVAVSNSTAPLITHLYGDWPILKVSARRAINSKGAGRGAIHELCVLLAPRGKKRRR